MAKRKKQQGRVDAAVAEAEAILKKLIDDTHVREALAGIIDAVGVSDDDEPQAEAKKKGGFGFGKLIAAAGVVGGGALAASSGLRNKVLDMLFGAEEEFQYTPPADGSADAGATNGQQAEAESAGGEATDGDGSSTPSAA